MGKAPLNLGLVWCYETRLTHVRAVEVCMGKPCHKPPTVPDLGCGQPDDDPHADEHEHKWHLVWHGIVALRTDPLTR